MDRLITRREALGAGLAAPLALLGQEGAAGADGSTSQWPLLAWSSGYFRVPPGDGVLIGLLLPAVQSATQPARLVLVNNAGQRVEIALPAVQQGVKTAFFRVAHEGPGTTAAVASLVIDEVGTERSFTLPRADGILIALLLPAVQRRTSPGLLAGCTQVFYEGEVQSLLPFIEQDNLYARTHQFFGPLTLEAEGKHEIGLLLPAVQRVRVPARLILLNGLGDVVAEIPLPTEGTDPVVPFHFLLVRNGELTRVFRQPPGADEELLVEAPTPEGVLIGLLLPAVQRNGKPAAVLGGSIRAGDETLPFSWGATQTGSF